MSTKPSVTVDQLIKMGLKDKANPEKKLSKPFISAIAAVTGNVPGLVEALAKDKGATITLEDPTNLLLHDPLKSHKLSFEQDTLLIYKVQNPQIFGQTVADLAAVVLWSCYGQTCKYAVVKTGLRGLLVNAAGNASSSQCEDAESETKIAFMAVINSFDIACGYKLITILDRRSCYHLYDCSREGMFRDNHKMNRKDQRIIKYLASHPDDFHNPEKIAAALNLSKDYVEKMLKETGGKAATDQSLEGMMEAMDEDRPDIGNISRDTLLRNAEWQVSDRDTQTEAMRNRLKEVVRHIAGNALTDDEQQLVLRTVAGYEKKTAVAKEMNISTDKANSIINEALGKMQLWLNVYHYDASTVSEIMAM